MEIRIDRANAGDLPALQKLYYELCGEMIERQKAARVLERMAAQESYHLLVARDASGLAVGTAMGIVCLDLAYQCDPFMLIENVIVLEEFRGKAIGKLLMDELERAARASGCSLTMLVSGALRVKAHQFYANLGYMEAKGFKKHLS